MNNIDFGEGDILKTHDDKILKSLDEVKTYIYNVLMEALHWESWKGGQVLKPKPKHVPSKVSYITYVRALYESLNELATYYINRSESGAVTFVGCHDLERALYFTNDDPALADYDEYDDEYFIICTPFGTIVYE